MNVHAADPSFRRKHPVLVYSVLRLAIFVLVVIVLHALGLRSILLLVASLLLSGAISLPLLSRQRDAVSTVVVNRQQRMGRALDEAAGREDEPAAAGQRDTGDAGRRDDTDNAGRRDDTQDAGYRDDTGDALHRDDTQDDRPDEPRKDHPDDRGPAGAGPLERP